MRIFRYEFKKLLLCPFLLGLLLVFAAFDVVMLFNDLSPKYYNYDGIYPAIIGSGAADEGAAEYYLSFRENFSAIYDELDMNEIFRQKMALYYPSVPPESAYYKWAQKNYMALQERVEEIRQTVEAGGDFYPGPAYKLHKKLCGLLSRSLLESLILTALAMLYLMDFERINAAEGLVYATKCGRSVQLKKMLAGGTFSLISSALLFALPLSVFAAVVPMKGLWRTSVSAFTLTEPTTFFSYPFVTWAKMSVFGQLAASLGLCALLVIITAAVCAGAYFAVRNSYLVMLGAGVAFLGMLLLPYAVPAGTMHTLSMMSPSVLWYNSGMWFIEFDPARGKWFEAATVALWAGIGALSAAAGWKRFKRCGI